MRIRTKKRAAARPQLGTWFALPLPSGGFLLGLIARRPEGRIPKPIFCYFFGPHVGSVSDFEIPIIRKAEERVFFARSNDRALGTNRWIVIDQIQSFNKEAWPMPPFRSGAVGGGSDYLRRRYLRTYDDNLQHCTSETLTIVDRITDYPQDIAFGHIAMENALDRVMSGTYEDH